MAAAVESRNGEAYAAPMTYEQRAVRLARARFWIRAEFTIAIAAVLSVGFLWVAQPASCMCPMFATYPPSLVQRLAELLPWVGIAGLAIGFAAMWRLARLDPERGERTWRYSRVARLPRAYPRIRAEIAVVVFAALAIGISLIARRGTMRGLFKLLLDQSLLPVVGLAGLVIGGVWIVWLFRDPEGDETTWRHR
jgi:hypothetical protein